MFKAQVIRLFFLVSFLAGVAGSVKAQRPPDNPHKPNHPEFASHGKMVSELARNTASGPEKGKIIRSAAHERGLHNANGIGISAQHHHYGQSPNRGIREVGQSGMAKHAPSPNIRGRSRAPGSGGVR